MDNANRAARRPAFFEASTLQANFAGYELLRRISGDKADEVFIARRPEAPGRLFALKRSCPLGDDGGPNDGDFFDDFTVESQLLAYLDHPTIPKLVDFGELDGWYYVALELPVGRDLAWIQTTCQPSRTRLPVELAVHIGREISRALAHLHERSDARGEPLHLSHQDVRPENIFVTDQGGVLLIPFGIVRSYRSADDISRGWIGRRHHYKAPEQVVGATDDPRSDLYALGVVLHDLLVEPTGPCPTILSGVRGLPTALRAIIRKTLQPAMRRRYQTARELTLDLLRLVRSEASWRPRERMELWMALWSIEAWSAYAPAPSAPLRPAAPAALAPRRVITAVTSVEPIRQRPRLSEVSRSEIPTLVDLVELRLPAL